MDDKVRRMMYLADSLKPWEPTKLAVPPWETGLSPSHEIRDIIAGTTAAIFKGIYDNTNDAK